MSIVDTYHPETAAGGFTRDDEGVEFYSRVNALIAPQSTVIDLGAGRGERFHENTNPFSLQLCRLQGRVKKLIGIDVDDAIREHPYLDECHIVGFDEKLPVADQSVDMVISEWVLEHVEDAANFSAEIDRVLKPGGWFCAITPNANGYVGIANRILTPWVKKKLICYVWPGRLEIDVFPTHYRLNTSRQLEKAFSTSQWQHHSYRSNPTPKYHGGKAWAYRLIGLFQRLAPDAFKTNMLIFIRKADTANQK